MPLPKEKASVSLNSNAETVTLKVADIMECDEVKELSNGKTIEFPYMLKYMDAKKREWTARTVASLKAKDWEKKFYRNNKGYWQFTRDHDVMAVIALMEEEGKVDIDEMRDKGETFDLNSIIGYKFKAAMIFTGDNSWIDWYETFKLNGVDVPVAGDGTDQLDQMVDEQSQHIEANKDTQTSMDSDDLPF